MATSVPANPQGRTQQRTIARRNLGPGSLRCARAPQRPLAFRRGPAYDSVVSNREPPTGRFDRWHLDALPQVAEYRVKAITGQFGHLATLEAARADEPLVELTVLDPQLVRHQREEELFLKLAGRAVGLRHPNLLSSREVARCDETGLAYVVSEPCRGRSLAELLASGRLGEEAALALLQPVVEGLAFAAERRLAHGSLEPGCVVLDEASTPRVKGLGLLRPVGEDRGRQQCLPPESLDAGIEPDVRVDLYAIGVILYRCLTGRWPFPGATRQELRAAQRERDVPDPREFEPDVSEGTARLVAWLTAREPRARYQAAHSASLDFLRLLAGRAPSGPRGARLRGPSELCELLLAVAARGGDGHEARGLWGKGPAYAFRAQLFTRGKLISEHSYNTEVLTLGRGADCELRIDNPIVSRRHARVRRVGAHFLLEPLSRTNSTSLGKAAISSLTWFKPGVDVHLSEKFRVRFAWAPGALADPHLPPPPDPEQWVEPPTQRFRVQEVLGPAEPSPSDAPPNLGPPPTEGPPPAWFLLARRGDRDLRLEVARPLQIGHATSCDLRLAADAPYKAALLVPTPGGLRLYNVTPLPGLVTVNDEAVHDQAVLEPGDSVRIGDLDLRVAEQ
ncbi:MAG: FHA domain-containing protein [Planctomycetota bacterium]|nr:MAG: FHA domain-containing protein [Planctomycetota bacterium]